MSDLADWRKRIDEIDQQLVRLLNERAQCAVESSLIWEKESSSWAAAIRPWMQPAPPVVWWAETGKLQSFIGAPEKRCLLLQKKFRPCWTRASN